MARPTTSSSSEQRRTTRTASTAAEPAPQGTGQEPDRRGVHRPGKAPGEYTDQGPVTLPVDAPRR